MQAQTWRPCFDDPSRCSLHRHPAQFACRPGMPGARGGKSRVRREALALTLDELERILETVDETGNDRVMVGFNRRFSPLLVEMRARFGQSIRADERPVSRQRRTTRGGQLVPGQRARRSRFVGEGGHFVDTMSWWIGTDPVEVSALPAGNPDEVQMSLRYGDGSLGDHHLRHKRPPTVPERDLRGLQWRADARWTTSTSHGVDRVAGPARRHLWTTGQGPVGRDQVPSSKSCEPVVRCRSRSDSLTATTRATSSPQEASQYAATQQQL